MRRVNFAYGFSGATLRKSSLENTGVGGRIMLKYVLKEYNGETGLDLSVTG